ncbi:MAG TPA: ferredoxin [Candidatus Pelethenecus faecipullorum]|uniref:Ferredoxin n=1 Tax=Candidatus Pelethenecus faecipullorum TaxID=2840900 RepID=A0A9D1GRL3_9MOLU|nr:ferredoxin [Candidatus Pelethenecus faecipullorum]
MKVKIIDGCIGCGLCVSICPNVFDLNEEGFSNVIADPSSADENNVKEAVDSCPVQVIVMEG